MFHAFVAMSVVAMFSSLQAAPQAACGDGAPSEGLVLPKVVHLAGISGVARNVSGELRLNDGELVFQRRKTSEALVPYARVDHVELLSSRRERYGDAAVGAAVATPFGLGGLLMTAGKDVELVIVHYRNDGGGLRGLVMQLPNGGGARLRERLTACGVRVDEPAPPPVPATTPVTERTR